MKLAIKHISPGKESTTGGFYIDGIFHCFTLEDATRKQKIAGETRIPNGIYKMALRTEGGMTKKYAARYPAMHKGMLWITGIPNFKYVYIHTGNHKDHTDGCPLLGDNLNNNMIENGFLGNSSRAYKRIYPMIAEAIESGRDVTIEISEA